MTQQQFLKKIDEYNNLPSVKDSIWTISFNAGYPYWFDTEHINNFTPLSSQGLLDEANYLLNDLSFDQELAGQNHNSCVEISKGIKSLLPVFRSFDTSYPLYSNEGNLLFFGPTFTSLSNTPLNPLSSLHPTSNLEFSQMVLPSKSNDFINQINQITEVLTASNSSTTSQLINDLIDTFPHFQYEINIPSSTSIDSFSMSNDFWTIDINHLPEGRKINLSKVRWYPENKFDDTPSQEVLFDCSDLKIYQGNRKINNKTK